MALRTLRAAFRQYRQQQRYTTLALAQAEKTWLTRNFPVLTALMVYLQVQSAQSGIDYIEDITDELEADAPLVATPVADVYGGFTSAGADLGSYLEGAETMDELLASVTTQLNDAARAAESVAIVARPGYDGYVRYLNPPSCSRCVVLAGRVYKVTDDFPRHTNCDCFMVPVEAGVNPYDFHIDPMEAFRQGQISDLTVAERSAILEGADISQVINVRRKGAGLTIAGRVLERGGRPTPEGIYHLASSRDEAIQMLIKAGYLRS